ncbi:MAG: ABC transporter ATP-binding protein [Phycisphaerales bacterium]|nr:ABC transporter ATP-binding protein [Phycisphaerales bacterium]
MSSTPYHLPSISTVRLLRWMFGFTRPVKSLLLLACVLLVLWTGAEIAAVRVTAEAVNQIKSFHVSDDYHAGGMIGWLFGDTPSAIGLRRIVLMLAGFTAVIGLLGFLRETTNAKLSMNMVFYIREAVYDKLQRVGFGFHDAISTGELINRALSDLQNVRLFINSAVLITLEIVLIVGGYIALLLSRSPWVALLALAPLPLWTWYILRFSRKAQPALQSIMETGDRNVSIITENIAGVHVVKAFGTERQEISRYDSNCDEFFTRVMYRIRLFANFTPVIRSIAAASHLTLFLAAGILILKGRLTAGDVLMLGAAMGAILNRLQQISVINDQYQSAVVSGRRLYEVLHAPPTVIQKPDARPLDPGPGAVRFEHVTFGYDPSKAVLHDIDFEVPAGKVVAVVGPTGSGKTTLVGLLARFYDPGQGRILIDGMDIRDATLDSLRAQIAYVFQETYLFSDTVEANIAYSHPRTSNGNVEAAARLAQAHEFINDLPKGYDTILGERGTTLSGGQRQRLAIARAICADPRILILDDATAAVDPETEHAIRRAIRLVMVDRTTFVIAHRVSTVKNADLVIVLENGRISQMGTHDELLLREGHYRQIVNGQLYGDPGGEEQGLSLSHMNRMREFVRRRRHVLEAADTEEVVNEPEL